MFAPIAFAGLLASAGTTSRAADFDFGFEGGVVVPGGDVVVLGSCGTDCFELRGRNNAFSNELQMTLYETDHVTYDALTGFFTGSWLQQSFDGDGNPNTLSGTLTGRVLASTPTRASGSIAYTVTGGSGLFDGVTGTGWANFQVDQASDPVGADYIAYAASGRFVVSTIPEPSTWATLALGLVALAGVARRPASTLRRFERTA
ncbi:MAG: PEP-CTERM sorting domain-containing protein [Solirubrobacteraceae bacterium]|nr:PEP-CTERM sorting domain-containing protein [Solirubrobacteraceae bacterium]